MSHQFSAVDASFFGHRAPAVGVESPFELLHACHERVQRSLDLLTRLQSHVEKNGCDSQAKSAASDILRYFDIAAPLHHQDEELHVFPLILASADIPARLLVEKLMAQHIQMQTRWLLAREVLHRMVHASTSERFVLMSQDTQLLIDFAALYATHMSDEELYVYPKAQALQKETDLQEMSREMGERRGANWRRSSA